MPKPLFLLQNNPVMYFDPSGYSGDPNCVSVKFTEPLEEDAGQAVTRIAYTANGRPKRIQRGNRVLQEYQ